jgi:uncharacterized protein
MQASARNGAVLTQMFTHLVDGAVHDRSHWQHGPIDIVMDLHGAKLQIDSAKQAMWLRFPQVLSELMLELTALRSNCFELKDGDLKGAIANRMRSAVLPFYQQFITPMAAVAGSVAQELLNIATTFDLSKVIVNNGGDIAIFGQDSEIIKIALLVPAGIAEFFFNEPREFGVATSGWSGRSFSLGIADAVTVVANTASQADAAATMIANAVGAEIQHSAIQRMPASILKDDTDLGDRLVTTQVEPLPQTLVTEVLLQGQQYANELLKRDLILSATLSLQGQSVIVADSANRLAHFQSFQFKLAA